MNEHLILKNRLKEVRKEKKLSQTELAEMVGVSRNTISSIETGQFNPTAKLALVLCIALSIILYLLPESFQHRNGGSAIIFLLPRSIPAPSSASESSPSILYRRAV